MINQQLVDYIKQQMQAGVAGASTRKALLDAGWTAADVNDSFGSIEPAAAAQPAAVVQQAVNPAVAMGGVDVQPKSSAAGAGSASDRFFAKPAGGAAQMPKDDDDDSDHPSVKKLMVTIIAMGIVMLLLAGALVFVYFNLNGQLEAARSGGLGGADQAALQQQIGQLTTDKDELNAEVEGLTADNDSLRGELSFVLPPLAGASSTPVAATVKGTLLNSASTTFSLVTAHNLKIIVANSADEKVSSALTPLVGGAGMVTLSGTHAPGSMNLTATAVNGVEL